jgi:diguanylate cyclase (GGDEF)-like protein
LASRDGLTGVLNHRAFQERFRDELLRAQRMGRNVALLMLDIDFFKRINDTYGHPVGDVVLRETAQILAQNVRAGVDVVARYGGEEFVCMLPDSDGRAALETAERIRQTLEAKEFDLGHARFRATLSIGGAVFPENAKHGKELLEKADKALYKAKDGGRNQVILYH